MNSDSPKHERTLFGCQLHTGCWAQMPGIVPLSVFWRRTIYARLIENLWSFRFAQFSVWSAKSKCPLIRHWTSSTGTVGNSGLRLPILTPHLIVFWMIKITILLSSSSNIDNLHFCFWSWGHILFNTWTVIECPNRRSNACINTNAWSTASSRRKFSY